MIVAEWTHKGGSIVTLETAGDRAYSISGPGSGGIIYAPCDDDAVRTVQTRIADGWYSRDTWTTPYLRVR